jgi:hypothetical protein
LEEEVLVPLYAGDGYTTQWHQLQTAAALARLLNRTLCLPPFMAHSNPGSKVCHA